MPGSFFDSNLLVFLASGDPRKADRAEDLLAAGGTISVQVLNELANVARRKMGMSWPEIVSFLTMIRGLVTVRDLTLETHDSGLALAERYGWSVYDAMIVASALQSGCDLLWSEDLQDGMLIENRLRIANPFVSR
jgi:predicted nucleic acid-binding protein